MNTINSTAQLRDVLYAFSLAKTVPDAPLLDEFVKRYPQYAAEITDFAIEVAIDAARDDDIEAEKAGTPVSPAVSRAMSRFQNKLFEVEHGKAAGATAASAVTSAAENPFATLDRTAFRGLANRLDVSTLFVAKLRDRQIDPKTMTNGFRKRVADELSVPLDVIVAHFAARPEGQPRQFYKAEQQPTTVAQQSFEEAVRSSGLTDEQQRHLMNM
jgi:hypothetical protein